jgi:putative addiction module killer protein
MEAKPQEVVFYVTKEDQCPFERWLEALRDRQARARIKKRLDRVELGNLGDFKPVGEGVLELRIDCGPGYRIYFSQVGDLIILLLCGGNKSTQRQDISRAKQYWTDFQERYNVNS